MVLKYLRKITEINVLSYLNLSLFFLIPYIFYFTYSIKEIYAFVLMLFLLVGLAVIIFLKKDIYFNLNLYKIIILAFIFSIFISGINNFEKNILVLQERLFVWLCISFIIIFYISSQNQNIRKIIDFMTFINFFIIIIGIFQYLSFMKFFEIPFLNKNTFNSRIYSIFGNPDNYAVYLIILLPLLIYKYIENNRIIFLFFILLNFISLLLTKSLSGIISILCQIIIFFIFFIKIILQKFNLKYKKIILLMLFLSIVVLFVNAFVFLSKKHDSINIRKFLWESSFLMIKNYPIFGVGSGNYRIFTPYYQGILYGKKNFPDYIEVHDEAYSHNDYIQVLSEQGITAFFIFLLLLFYPFYKFIKKHDKDNNIYYPFIISMSGVLIFAIFNFPFSNPFVIFFYILSGFILCDKDDFKIIRINSQFKLIILFIIFIMIFLNIKFTKNFYERYYLIQYFSYQLAKGNLENMHNYIAKYKEIIKDDYQLNFYSGTALNFLKNYEEAKIYFLKAIKLFPYFSSAYYNLGNSLSNNGELESAGEIYEKLLKFNPTYKSAYNNLGTIYIQKGEIDKALNTLRNGLKYDKNSKYLNYNLALCYYIKNEYEKAEKILANILEQDKNFMPAIELKSKIKGIKK